MSKYEDWKEMVSHWYKGEALEELHKIIDKAEKYDEICDSSDIDLVVEFDELGMSPTTLVPDVKECEDSFRRRILTLIKENKELKEGIKEMFNSDNLEYYDSDNLESNFIGTKKKVYVNAYNLHYDFEDNDYGGIEYPYLVDEDGKIKKMLDLVEEQEE